MKETTPSNSQTKKVSDRVIGAGDIAASYSGDVIAQQGRVRKPFTFQADLLVAIALSGMGGVEEAEAYHLVPSSVFTGTPTSYRDKTAAENDAVSPRDDPNGAYHGMKVIWAKESFVLCGPPTVFVADTPSQREQPQPRAAKQLSLF
jgi:hypothetical protein